MSKYTRAAVALLSIFCALIVAGCRCSDAVGQGGDVGGRGDGNSLEEYLADVKKTFRDRRFVDDEMIGCALTTREYKSKYEIIYTDRSRTIFSYRYLGFSYTGGAHGATIVGIGTIDVATGRKLTVADVIPADKRAEALARVKKAVVEKIGAENLSGEVTLTDNFCVAADGLHFVFNEYELAAYCFGAIEVVIPAYGK